MATALWRLLFYFRRLNVRRNGWLNGVAESRNAAVIAALRGVWPRRLEAAA